MANPKNQTLGRIALIGMTAVLILDLIDASHSQGSVRLGLAAWMVMSVAIAGAALVLMPKASRLLLRNLQLLIPLGLLMIATRLIGWMMLIPFLDSMLTRSFPLQFLNFSSSLSLSLVLYILLNVAYGTWTTVLVVRLVRSNACNPLAVFSEVKKYFLRIFGLECIGTIVLMLGSTLFLLLMKVNMILALGGMAALAVLWNFSTAALLPIAVEHKGTFRSALRTGITTSLANAYRWGFLLLAQMFLLGLVIYFYRSSGHTSNSDFSVNAFWIGAYESDCRWYPSIAKRFNTYTIPLFETLLSLVFGTFAIAVKLAITQRLHAKRS